MNGGNLYRAMIRWARGVVATRDAGFTEIDPGTITVLGLWQSE